MPIKAIKIRTIFIAIILIVILLITVSIITIKNPKNQQKMEQPITQIEPKEPYYKIRIKPKQIKLEIPSQYEDYPIIGKLEIPKINLTTYIMDKTNKEHLIKSLTKLGGPDINKVGNFCITGHNYIRSNMFWRLKELEMGDKIKLTDLYGQYYIYKVYAIEKVSPNDTSCLEQETRRRKKGNTNYLYHRSTTEASN